MKRIAAVLCILALSIPFEAQSADDPNIKGEEREGIQKSMESYVKRNSIKKEYVIYNAVEGKLLWLNYKALHEGIVKKGEFYVSCADFTDGSDNLYDVDFLVARKGKNFRVLQALVHSVNGEKRTYHLEK